MTRIPDGSSVSTTLSRRQALVWLGGTALALGACSETTSSGGNNPYLTPPPVTPLTSGETLGTGTVRVALLLPKTATLGNGAALALAMQNAASLGLGDFTGNDLTLLVKDTKGTGEGATLAAQTALSEGAELIIGPLFAPEVAAVGPIARAANVPVIAFSSDPSVAAPGVFLLGFLVDGQVQRVMAEAAKAGRKSVAAIISQSAYGNLAEASLRQSAGRYGLRVAQVERFPAGAAAQAVAAVVANAAQVDCIFVPEGPGVAPLVAQGLRSAGVDLNRIKLIGSGVWNDRGLLADPALAGGWFPSPDLGGVATFASRYGATYGGEPPLTASLAYDAVVLAAGLVKTAGAQRFQMATLTNPQGFLSSVNGLFRFNPNGTNDRGLAVYQVGGGAPTLVSPAARAFTAA
jgi:ABC-type branched-subunit amino acid transport system substrate-binding protein